MAKDESSDKDVVSGLEAEVIRKLRTENERLRIRLTYRPFSLAFTASTVYFLGVFIVSIATFYFYNREKPSPDLIIPPSYSAALERLVIQAALAETGAKSEDVFEVYKFLDQRSTDELIRIAGNPDRCEIMNCYSVKPDTVGTFANSIISKKNNDAILVYTKQQAEAAQKQAASAYEQNIINYFVALFAFMSFIAAAISAKIASDAASS